MGRQLKIKVGIIGCGLVGYKRSKSLGSMGMLVACSDKDISKAQIVANNKKIKILKNWKKFSLKL